MMIETLVIGSGLVVVSPMVGRLSDAAAGLGDAGDLGCDLRRSLGEELVELFDGHAGGLAQEPDGGSRALLGVLGAHELDDAPVVLGEGVDAFGGGELGGHGFGPLVGV